MVLKPHAFAARRTLGISSAGISHRSRHVSPFASAGLFDNEGFLFHAATSALLSRRVCAAHREAMARGTGGASQWRSSCVVIWSMHSRTIPARSVLFSFA
jgi:hypothetical protein